MAYREYSDLIRPRLPPEIIDHIIDHLPTWDSLRACALVCRAWLAPSRSRLFYRVKINFLHRYPSCRRLCEAIQQSPDIALYVRELCCSPEEEYEWIPRKSEARLESINIVSRLLRSFTALHTLEIAGFRWASLMPDIQESFHAILTLPSLVHFRVIFVKFSGLKELLGLLRPHLKHLFLFYGTLQPLDNGDRINTGLQYYDEDHDDDEDGGGQDDNENENGDDYGSEHDNLAMELVNPDQQIQWEMEVNREPCFLEHLTLFPVLWRNTSELIGCLTTSQSVIDLSNLRTLKCESYFNFHSSVTKLIRRTTSSIEHLYVQIHAEYRGYEHADAIDIGYSPKLQTFFLEISLDEGTTQYVTRMLSTLRAPSLRCISIDFIFRGVLSPESTISPDWIGVDRMLDSEAFGSLRSVRIQVLAHKSILRHVNPSIVRRNIIAHSPLLLSRGLLEVEVVIKERFS